jgi:hypothetical protein
MDDITIDTGVLFIASGLSDQSAEVCRALIEKIEGGTELHLALDSSGQIESEYQHRMNDSSALGRRFVENLARTSRLKWVNWQSSWNHVRVPLEQDNFHSKDKKFVRTAMASDSKHLVAEEAGFFKKNVPRTLKQKGGIRLHKAQEALNCFSEPNSGS